MTETPTTEREEQLAQMVGISVDALRKRLTETPGERQKRIEKAKWAARQKYIDQKMARIEQFWAWGPVDALSRMTAPNRNNMEPLWMLNEPPLTPEYIAWAERRLQGYDDGPPPARTSDDSP